MRYAFLATGSELMLTDPNEKPVPNVHTAANRLIETDRFEQLPDPTCGHAEEHRHFREGARLRAAHIEGAPHTLAWPDAGRGPAMSNALIEKLTFNELNASGYGGCNASCALANLHTKPNENGGVKWKGPCSGCSRSHLV
jgi:hypothetical protein